MRPHSRGYDRRVRAGSAKRTRLVVVLVILAAGGLYATFGDLGPDTATATAQEKTATACLRAAGLDVKSEIPPFSRFGSPEYVLDVDAPAAGHDHIAFVFLFDDTAAAQQYFERQKDDAEDEAPPKGLKIEQRGPDVVRLFSADPNAARIRECVDRGAKPPSGEK